MFTQPVTTYAGTHHASTSAFNSPGAGARRDPDHDRRPGRAQDVPPRRPVRPRAEHDGRLRRPAAQARRPPGSPRRPRPGAQRHHRHPARHRSSSPTTHDGAVAKLDGRLRRAGPTATPCSPTRPPPAQMVLAGIVWGDPDEVVGPRPGARRARPRRVRRQPGRRPRRHRRRRPRRRDAHQGARLIERDVLRRFRPGRRVHRRGLRRQPRRRRARRRRASTTTTCSASPAGRTCRRRRSSLPPTHARRRLPRAHLHAGARAAVRRTPDARDLPRLARGRRRAGRRRRDRPGVPRRPRAASAAPSTAWPSPRRRCCAPARSTPTLVDRARRRVRRRPGDGRRRRVGRQRPRLGRPAARLAPTPCSPPSRTFVERRASAWSGPTRRARPHAIEVRAFFP